MKHNDFDGINRSYKELTTVFCKKKPNLDIVAYFFAEDGAQGMNGDVKILTTNSKWYHGNFCYGKITEGDAISLLPGLEDFNPRFDGLATNIPQGYYYQYLGMGNHLFVNETYSETFKYIFSRIPKDDQYFIYQIVLDAIISNAK